MKRALVIVLLVAACGGDDPLNSVENCSELMEAAASIEEPTQADRDKVRELAREMGGDAIARGAELEASICGQALLEVAGSEVEETFSEIGSGLDD